MALLHLHASAGQIEFLETCWLQDDREILNWVERRCEATTVLGIDAPIIAPNPPGTGRPCDREVSSKYARYEAGAFPANRNKCKRPIRLRQKLEESKFSSNPQLAPRTKGHWQIEVYPHPAQVVLFNLSKTLKYKKGRVEERRSELNKLGKHISTDLAKQEPKLISNETLYELCKIDDTLKGKGLKEREDRLDAVVCGYVAAYYWTWGLNRCEVIGEEIEKGYIICPKFLDD